MLPPLLCPTTSSGGKPGAASRQHRHLLMPAPGGSYISKETQCRMSGRVDNQHSAFGHHLQVLTGTQLACLAGSTTSHSAGGRSSAAPQYFLRQSICCLNACSARTRTPCVAMRSFPIVVHGLCFVGRQTVDGLQGASSWCWRLPCSILPTNSSTHAEGGSC